LIELSTGSNSCNLQKAMHHAVQIATLRGAIKSDPHELGDASNYAGSARLALLAHPQRKASLALQHHF